jgi:hypothetical protein
LIESKVGAIEGGGAGEGNHGVVEFQLDDIQSLGDEFWTCSTGNDC